MKIKDTEDYVEIDLGVEEGTIIMIILGITSLIINLYYFNANTGIWWDEAEYLSFVNHVVKGSPYSMWAGRAIFYPLMLSVLGFINNSETFLRIGLLLINLVTIVFTYLTLKELFNEKISSISTLLFLTSPLFLFSTHRFLTGIPSLMFIIIGLYFFLKEDYKMRFWSGLFIGCAVATRFTSVFIIPSLILYDLLNKKELKYYLWIPALLVGFIPTMLFDISQGNLPWKTLKTFFVQSTAERTTGHNIAEWTFYIFNLPTIIGQQSNLFWLWIILFLLGTLISVVKIIHSLKKRFKKKKEENKKGINLLISITYIMVHFLMYAFLTPRKEMRYLIPILPFLFSITSIGLVNLCAFLNKIIKRWLNIPKLKTILVLLTIGIFCFQSVQVGDVMIRNKATTYVELAEAGELLKENTAPSEIILTNEGPHVAYYAEREVISLPSTMSGLYEKMNNNTNMNFILLSFYENPPNYVNKFMNNTNFTLVKDYSRNNMTIVGLLGYLRD